MSGEIMGLFVVPKNYDKSSIEEYLEACIENIKLYLRNPDSDYLIEGFANSQLAEAIKKINAKKELTTIN